MPKKIIIGITGSIAAYKAIQLVSDLMKKDYIVEVLMSESGAKFVSPVTIQALTKRKVYIDTFDDDPSSITHIDIVKDADLFVIVPASAHTIAKVAYGFADNMLTCAYLAATCPKVIAPAMNVHMYENPITQKNIQTLKDSGVIFVEPIEGMLACGAVGKGKLASQEDIMDVIDYALASKPLRRKKVLVSAGPTIENIDPVRFITNHSSGKMGYALAKAAYCLGAEVTLVSGPTHIRVPYGVHLQMITSAQDMYETIIKQQDEQDMIIMSAAVGDYACDHVEEEKIKKSDDTLSLVLHKNKDILYELGQHKKDNQILCGFAMETQNLIDNAKEKLEKKNCDMIVANHLKTEGAGFQGDTNVVSILTKEKITQYDLMTKEDLAYEILRLLMEV